MAVGEVRRGLIGVSLGRDELLEEKAATAIIMAKLYRIKGHESKREWFSKRRSFYKGCQITYERLPDTSLPHLMSASVLLATKDGR